MKIEEMGLIEPALSGAHELKYKHPEIEFTSGRRDRFRQAHAMAVNVVGDPDWIKRTYKDHAITRDCQTFVDEHPDLTADDYFGAFLTILNGYSDAELAEWNHHVAGLAFDVKPQIPNADQIKSDIRALPHLNLFLEQEGNLVRWHAQFNPV
jgi:hypothetical protein